MSQVDSIRAGSNITELVSEWRHHRPEFVGVREYDDGRPIVVMELLPPDAEVMHAAWSEVTRLWLDLPPHANILDAIARDGRSGLLVRFAAIDWAREPLVLEGERRSHRLAAVWGLQLCDAMTVLVDEVAAGERGWFACPMVMVDIDDQVRLGFLPVAPHHPQVGRFVAPEARAGFPRCDEQALVYLVGIALDELTDSFLELPSPVTRVIERCRQESPAARYQSLRDLRRALRAAGSVTPKQRQRRDAEEWRELEERLAWKTIRPPPPPIERHMPWAAEPRGPGPRARPPLPGSARAYFVEGKTFLRDGRLAEARTCFERALALDPMMIEAMHLRREVDRCMIRARAEAGHAWPVRQDIDEALAKSAHLEAMLAKLEDE